MAPKSPIATLSELAAPTDDVFRGRAATSLKVTRDQLADACAQGVIARPLPDTYRFVAVPESDRQRLRAALLWAGEDAAGAGRSAGAVYALEGV
jgi:hypothetical protein